MHDLVNRALDFLKPVIDVSRVQTGDIALATNLSDLLC
jgi:hypothetical protein